MTPLSSNPFGAAALSAGLAFGLGGCSLFGAAGNLFGGDSDTGGTDEPEEVVPADAPSGGCASALDEAVLDEQMGLFVAIRETVHDLGIGVAAEHDARVRLAALPRTLLLQPERVQPPVGLEWVGDGVYVGDSDLVAFDIVARWSGGPDDGTPIGHDLFDAENYFTDLLVATDASQGTVTLRFREKGPLAALLGFGELASGDSVPLSALEQPASGLTLAFEASLDANLDGSVVVGSLEGSAVAPGEVREATLLRTMRGRNSRQQQRIVTAPLTVTETPEEVVASTLVEVRGDILSYTGEVEITDGVLTKAESRCPRD